MADYTDLTTKVLIFPHKQIEIEREMRLFFGWRTLVGEMNVFANQKRISRFSFFILGFSKFEIFIWYFRVLGFDNFAWFGKIV